MKIISEITSYLQAELTLLNEKILFYFQKRESLIKTIGDYIVNSGGKKIRSIYAILLYKILLNDERNDKIDDRLITSCAAIELIHMATLLHDDVIDESAIRRSLPSVNVVWGDKASILVGDFLLSQAFNFLVSVESWRVLDILAHASSLIIEGEVSQLSQLKQKTFYPEEKYFHIIDLKTAELFSASFAVSVVLRSKTEHLDLFKQYGVLVGRIFQITDDLLDYGFNRYPLNKSIGEDFKEGKITLPLILLHKYLALSDKIKLEKLLSGSWRSNEDFLWVQNQMANFKITEHLKHVIFDLEKQSLLLLEKLQTNQDKDLKLLKDLTNSIVHRVAYGAC